jgi:hypothetical protein
MKNTICALAALVLAPVPLVMAGTEKVDKNPKNPIETVKESCITGDLGVNFVSQYVSRGVVLENQGVIGQPYADLYFKLYEGDGFLNKISLNLGLWSSIHSRATDAGAIGGGSTGTKSWYEFDYTVGLAFTFAKNWTLTPSFYAFLSPNDGFSDFYGLNLSLAYNDAELWGNSGFALNPSVTVLVELQNKAGTGKDEGVYYEIALNPTKAYGPVTVSLPIKAGFGTNDFYGSLNASTGAIDNESFGYVSAGLNVAYALKFIPECYGVWTLSANATFYYLGDGTSDFNTAPRGGSVRDGNDTEWVFGGGLGIAF